MALNLWEHYSETTGRIKTRLVNRHRVPGYDIYIGRGTKWGCPFRIGPDGTREEVIEKYRQWIQTQPHLLADLHELAGKTLGCSCKPKPCHGDVLLELLKEKGLD